MSRNHREGPRDVTLFNEALGELFGAMALGKLEKRLNVEPVRDGIDSVTVRAGRV